MGINLKCHKCGKYFIDMQGEYCIDDEKGVFKCPECGEILIIGDDTVEYDINLFYYNQINDRKDRHKV